MPMARLDGQRTPYDAEIARRVTDRTPLGLGIFLACVVLSAGFEILRFPERFGWMMGFAAGFGLLSAVAWALVERRPSWTIPVMIAFVNVIGVALNAYHVEVRASVAMCIWTLTGLLAGSALILPWGPRNQALAGLGALASYPLHLVAGTADPLTWAAGGTYLLVVTSLSVFGASLFARSARRDLFLTSALTEREARLQSYFDLSSVGTAILTKDARATDVNDELGRMLGYSRAELPGRSWFDLVHPDDRVPAAALLATALSGREEPLRRDMICMRRSGEPVHAIVSMRGLPGPAGDVDHVIVIVQDITERKRVEAEREDYLARADVARREAEAANRAKDAFLATVSHELRTPLTPILAWSGVLRQGQVGPDQMRAAIASIQSNARTQARLIDDLLDVSRIISGDWRLFLRPVELGPVIRSALEVVRPSADAKGVLLEATLPSEAVSVLGDPDRLQQVIWNLAANGVKFTPAGGTVQVSLEPVEECARMVVRDTGEGIDPDFLPQIFERFRQADSSTTRRHGGLGLGLAIVRALVERHAGSVRAASAGKGRGTVFTVDLPLVGRAVADAGAAESRNRSAADADSARVALDGLRVLVVDDDVDSSGVVAALLASCGADVRTAASAAEALGIAGQWGPDVLVSDVAMPGEDGCTLLRKLRAWKGHVPAVALTAYAGSADRARVLDAGFEEYLAKPFDPGQLAATVERAVHGAPRPSA